jgi:hypothetical protein
MACSPSVIIGDFDFIRSVSLPEKTNLPLIVDPDAVLPDPIRFQYLQPVPGGESRSLRSEALSSMVSFRSAAFLKPENSLTIRPEKNPSVFLSRKLLIIVKISYYTLYVTGTIIIRHYAKFVLKIVKNYRIRCNQSKQYKAHKPLNFQDKRGSLRNIELFE